MKNRQPLDRSTAATIPASLLLDAFIIAARHRGVHLSREQVLRDHQLKSPEVTVSQVMSIARKAGMRGRSVRLRWQDLFKMGTALPAIAMLRNGSAMVLLGVRPGRGGQPDVVVLLDPGGDEDAPLILDAGALHRCLERRGRSDQARLPPARRGPSVRHGLDRRPAAARPADDPRSRDLRASAQRPGARADRVLADHDRPGHALRQPQHLHDAVHRLRGAGGVRHRLRPSAPSDGAVPDDPGRRQDLESYVRSAAQSSDRLLRAHADRRDRARYVRDL